MYCTYNTTATEILISKPHQFHHITQFGIQQLSCGLDVLAWTDVQKILYEKFCNLYIGLTVFALTTSPVTTTTVEKSLTTFFRAALTQDIEVVKF